MNKTIVVTGLGMLHPLGVGYKKCWEQICCGAKPVVTPPGVLRMEGFDADQHIDHEQTRRMDRVSQMLAVVVDQLLTDATMAQSGDYEKTGLCVSTDFGTLDTIIQFSQRIYQQTPNRANPLEFPNTVLNASAGHACIVYGIKGHNNTMAGYGALSEAFDAIILDRAQAMMAAGLEEAGIYQQQTIEQYADDFPKPFHFKSKGPWLGEGAAGLFLESQENAESRGKKIYARYLGYQAGFDDPRTLSKTGLILEKSIRAVLEKNNRTVQDVVGIVIAGAGFNESEALMSQALLTVFQANASRVTCFPVAGALGSLGGAEECFGAVCAVIALASGRWPALPWMQFEPEAYRLGNFQLSAASRPFQGRGVLLVAANRDGMHQVHFFEKAV
ncbi:hypothetical protein K8S19_09715 [bacterium]|nr:hypothetical protein [bacterium]